MVTKDCDKGCRGKHSRKFPFFRNPFVFVVLWLVLAVAIGAIIMLLWNWLMPVIFGLPVLSLWQALGLFVLTRILFGSFGFGRRGMPGRGGNPVHEKWMHMTPEQRREFIKKGNIWASVRGTENVSLTGRILAGIRMQTLVRVPM